MPGGFNSSAIKNYLSKSWGLGSSRSDSVLLLGTILEPFSNLPNDLLPTRKGRVGLIALFLFMLSVLAFPWHLRAGGASGGGGGGAVINSEEFLKFQSDQQKFAAQHVELYMRYLARDSRAGEVAFDQEKATTLGLQAKPR
jgi:fatty acid synthase subunit alpha